MHTDLTDQTDKGRSSKNKGNLTRMKGMQGITSKAKVIFWFKQKGRVKDFIPFIPFIPVKILFLI